MEKARKFILKIFELLMKPEMRIMPGQLAFFLVMTVIPLVALIATIAATLSISTEVVSVAISSSVPKEIAEMLNSIIQGQGISFNIIVFFFSAFLLASNGAYSMINTSNEIYKIAPSNMISRRIKAIIMTFIFVGLFLFLILVPVFGSSIFKIIVEITGNTKLVLFLQKFLSILKYPIMLIILFMNIKLIYVIAPDSEIPENSTNIGAAFTSLGWMLSSEIFAFYIEKFTKYDVFYGNLSNILVLLLWIYLLSYIFVLGMTINASYKED